ncbi:FixH family protein [Halomonas sp. 328]|uniref:FixH family protein n=1 Tax=Halomonas sp. 328 TaxID=2776704 RepID=UPI0018A7158A|nr:FixH family protein [Halomonas sp. 328]MBF8221784.1 FixH family protein [Halomonas sp. 328]
MESQSVSPWYKQFWPWFLLIILGASMISSTTFLVLSIRTADGMVQEDYYEHGRSINMVVAKQQRAAELGLEGQLQVDRLSGDVTLDLAGESQPEALVLRLIFPTQDGRDQELTLHHQRDGRYVGQAPSQLQYRWYLQLQPAVEPPEWRLLGEARFPEDGAIVLTPNLRQR